MGQTWFHSVKWLFFKRTFSHWSDVSNEVHKVPEFPVLKLQLEVKSPFFSDFLTWTDFFLLPTLMFGHFWNSGNSGTLCTSFERSDQWLSGSTTKWSQKLQGVASLLFYTTCSGKAILFYKIEFVPICFFHHCTLIRFSKYPAITSKSSFLNFGLKIHVHTAKI